MRGGSTAGGHVDVQVVQPVSFTLAPGAGISAEASHGRNPRERDRAEYVGAVDEHGQAAVGGHADRYRHKGARIPGWDLHAGDVDTAVANLHAGAIYVTAGRVRRESIVVHAEAEAGAAAIFR